MNSIPKVEDTIVSLIIPNRYQHQLFFYSLVCFRIFLEVKAAVGVDANCSPTSQNNLSLLIFFIEMVMIEYQT
jgi:hypothetical protein